VVRRDVELTRRNAPSGRAGEPVDHAAQRRMGQLAGGSAASAARSAATAAGRAWGSSIVKAQQVIMVATRQGLQQGRDQAALSSPICSRVSLR